jgi:hypothetical protein
MGIIITGIIDVGPSEYRSRSLRSDCTIDQQVHDANVSPMTFAIAEFNARALAKRRHPRTPWVRTFQ